MKEMDVLINGFNVNSFVYFKFRIFSITSLLLENSNFNNSFWYNDIQWQIVSHMDLINLNFCKNI